MLHLHLISKKVANERGFKRYFTGKPCRRGGLGERATLDNKCQCELCREHRTAKDKERYWRDPEKARSYHHENRDHNIKRMREYHFENRDEILERKRGYYWDNVEREAERNKIYRVENLDACKERCSRYHAWRYANDREWFRAKNAQYRATKNDRSVGDKRLTEFVLAEAYQQARDLSEMMGGEFHVDHMIPMRAENVSGLHVPQNIQVIPAKMNLHKRNRMIYTEPFEWLADYS